MLNTILQLAISGAALGFVYALVGIEYSLIWNATGLLNFSHDKIITLGAYVAAGIFFTKMGLPIPVSFILAIVVVGEAVNAGACLGLVAILGGLYFVLRSEQAPVGAKVKTVAQNA